MDATTCLDWAERTFGDAQLGNQLRTRRAVRIAAAVAQKPAGRVTAVVKDPAQREGAFRFLENEKVAACELARSSHLATARACQSPWVFVPVDQTTLSVTDHEASKGFGPCGSRNSSKKRGAEVMSGLAVAPNGTPLGLLTQRWWRRSEELCPSYNEDCRPVEQRESDLWLQAMQEVHDNLQAGSGSRPWFQLDRGGDFWRVFEFAQQHDAWLTVRSAYDRCLWDSEIPLHQYIAKAQCRGGMEVHIPARRLPKKPRRAARTARVALRFERVELEMTDDEGNRFVVDNLTVIHVQERGSRRDQLEWFLLTTYPVKTVADAKFVVLGYTQRWRVEDFHHAWKSGTCDVERSQLRSPGAFCRWATILAAVAARVEQLKHLSRTMPQAPASDHLTRDEIDAAILLSETRKFAVGDQLTLAQAVELIAQAGGYTGKSSGGPPGTITISRGLRDVQVAAAVAGRLRKT